MTKYHYTYRITNKVEQKHYYGARTSIIHPSEDLGIKYFSSSSNKEFLIGQKDNPDNFKYKVIKIFETREAALSLEVKLHAKFNVGVNESFYNKAKQTTTRFDTAGTHVIFSKEHKEKLSKIQKELWNDKEFRNTKGKVRIEKGLQTREKRGITYKGEKNPMYKNGEKISGEKNGMHKNNFKGDIIEIGKKISDKLKGNIPWNKNKTNIYSEETIEKMKLAKKDYVPWIKGKKQPEFFCEHCERQIAGKTNFMRWHGEKCKKKI